MPYRFYAAFFITFLVMCAFVLRAENGIIFKEDFAKPLGERWKPIKFHDSTDYRIMTENSNACLKASAAGGCSALATKVDITPQSGMTCSWSWKIARCPKNGTDYKIAGFDHAARVFVAFDTWIGPPRTINYVWANHAPTNSTFQHPYTSRAKFIAVQSGNERAGQWLAESRDIQKDWALLFKDEPMPKITAIGVFTDSHYTREAITGWYRDIVLTK